MMEIAVLITCHNRKVKTLACLDALYKNNIPEGYFYEVFLVDDGSIDGTGEAVKSNYPKVNIIQGNGNLYWNRGMYLAWQTANKTKYFDFFLWLNDDTILNTNAINKLINSSLSLFNCNIIIGTTSSTNNLSTITYGGRKKNGLLITPRDTNLICNFFNGNIVLIPYYVFREVGFNDPIFHHALGDFDYGLRAHKKGISSYIAPDILGYCDEHFDIPNWCNPKVSFKKRLKEFKKPLGHNPEEFFIFEKRHYGFINATFHYITNYMRVLLPQLWMHKNNYL